MQDGIIKGEGNSRYLKSVSDFLTHYPTYEAFANALIAGTLPIDLNGINTDGWTQLGTALNKDNLLSDGAVAEIWPDETERPANPVMNDAFIELSKTAASGSMAVVSDIYTGTGVYGENNPNTLTFDFAPNVVFIFAPSGNMAIFSPYSNTYFYIDRSANYSGTSSWDASTLTLQWYHGGNIGYQMNTADMVYTWVAF